MLRTVAWVLVVWGVAVWATQGFHLLLGITPVEDMAPGVVAGAILVGVGYWLERRTRRKRDEPPGGEQPPAEDA
jgi:hypothetical protein